MKENQMRICFISLAQFDKIWYKMFPAQRTLPGLSTASIFHGGLNTLFIVGELEDFLVKPEDVLRKDWLVTETELRATGEAVTGEAA